MGNVKAVIFLVVISVFVISISVCLDSERRDFKNRISALEEQMKERK